MAPFGEVEGPTRTWGNDLSHRQILEECQRLQPGEQWKDKRFLADDPRSIYVSGRPKSGKPYAGGNIRWLRPHEVKGADPALLSLVLGGAEAGDVVQGELGDCYLLGAMSSIASKDLLAPLLKTFLLLAAVISWHWALMATYPRDGTKASFVLFLSRACLRIRTSIAVCFFCLLSSFFVLFY